MGEAKITFHLTKDKDGIVHISRQMESEGFHLYELVGLLQVQAYELTKESLKVGKQKSKK